MLLAPPALTWPVPALPCLSVAARLLSLCPPERRSFTLFHGAGLRHTRLNNAGFHRRLNGAWLHGTRLNNARLTRLHGALCPLALPRRALHRLRPVSGSGP